MTEGERIIKLETKMDNIESKIDDVKKMLEDFIKNSDSQFASKWVERAVWGFVAVAGGGIILGVISKYLIK